MRLERLPTSQIRPQARNANKMSEEQYASLKAFIARVGYVQPVYVHPTDNDLYLIIDGAHRFKALTELGHKEILCVIKENEEDDEYLQIGLNNNRGGPDYAMAALMLSDLAKSGHSLDDLSLTGLSKDDIEALIRATNTGTQELDAMIKQPVPEAPKSTEGKIWKIELEYADKATYLKCKRLLSRADPQNGKDLSRGLLKVLDLL